MNKQKSFQLFTSLGLLAVLFLQSTWLYNTYIFVKDNLSKEYTAILNEALYEEINLISKEVPEGTVIGEASPYDSIPINTYLYDGLNRLGCKFSIHAIDSLICIRFKKNKINDEYQIQIVDFNNQTIYETIKLNTVYKWGVIKTQTIPLRLDKSQGIQLVLTNPYWSIFERMWVIFISTIIITLCIIICIIYQIKIIFRLNKIFQIREDFSYALIHDMKTPLSTIFMTLNFLHSGRLDDKPEMKERYYKIAESEADHLLTLTNKVLTISKLESHKLEMIKDEVALMPMINKLVEKFTTKTNKPVNFTIKLEAPEAYADEEYLEEAISNLIDNAIKYSKDTVDVKISSESNELYTIIKIHDNGLGISDKDQRIIFNKYERAAASKRSRKGGATGFGLGLNFVYQIITAHEGKIIVNSIEGEFTEFIIYLPQIIQKL